MEETKLTAKKLVLSHGLLMVGYGFTLAGLGSSDLGYARILLFFAICMPLIAMAHALDKRRESDEAAFRTATGGVVLPWAILTLVTIALIVS